MSLNMTVLRNWVEQTGENIDSYFHYSAFHQSPSFLKSIVCFGCKASSLFSEIKVGYYEHVVTVFWRLDTKINSLHSVMILQIVQIPVSLTVT